jgi:hypothetical protein
MARSELISKFEFYRAKSAIYNVSVSPYPLVIQFASFPLSVASFYMASANGIFVQYRKLLDQLAGRAQLSDLLRDFLDRYHELGGFSRRDPGEVKAAGFYTHIFN